MGYRPFLLKSLSNDILDLSKLKALAGDKRNSYQTYKFGFNKEENSVGKGENAGYKLKALAYEKEKSNSKYEFDFKKLATGH